MMLGIDQCTSSQLDDYASSMESHGTGQYYFIYKAIVCNRCLFACLMSLSAEKIQINVKLTISQLQRQSAIASSSLISTFSTMTAVIHFIIFYLLLHVFADLRITQTLSISFLC